jgi:hypothetical protein
MDRLFAGLCKSDPAFLAAWRTVPCRSCELPNEAHALAGKCFQTTPALVAALLADLPPVMKLSHHEALTPGCNAARILEASRVEREGRPLVWQEQPSLQGATFF